MVISAVNAMTLTPSRAVAIFRTEVDQSGHMHRKEVLPWWIFAVAGGVLTWWVAEKYLAGRFGLPANPSGLPRWEFWGLRVATFLPGAVAGGPSAPRRDRPHDAGGGAAGQHRHVVPPADLDRGPHVVGAHRLHDPDRDVPVVGGVGGERCDGDSRWQNREPLQEAWATSAAARLARVQDLACEDGWSVLVQDQAEAPVIAHSYQSTRIHPPGQTYDSRFARAGFPPE